MNSSNPVPLIRRFSPVPASEGESDEQQIKVLYGYGTFSTWEDIDKGYRSVVLAEAGAGKTFEMQARAKYAEQQGRAAFFIRIEDIEGHFTRSFEIGDAESFARWLGSEHDAWFYLDSVDEARLKDATAFRKAIGRFGEEIKNAQHRAHVCISSRPYAWRPQSDRRLIEQYLPLPKARVEATDGSLQTVGSPEPQAALEVFVLQPLDERDIRQFAQHRSVPEIDALIGELGRMDLWSLAARPFDLEGILYKWTSHRELGGRRDLLHHNVAMRLEESHDPDGDDRRPLNLVRAMEGARRLAAAVVLTGEPGIRVPDATHAQPGIAAKAVLSDWKPPDVRTLLERGVFDGVIYGAVRFRHREVREFLAAGWFSDLLQEGHSRDEIERLFFREHYGHQFVAPRLRAVLPWLILDDNEMRSRVLADHPGIAMEGGDPARLPLPIRKEILSDVVERLVHREDCGAAEDNTALARIAHTDLTDHTFALIDRYSESDEALFFLGRLVWQGEMSGCASQLARVAANRARGTYVRIAATHAVTTCGTPEQRRDLWDTLLASGEVIHREILADLVKGADETDIARVLRSLELLSQDSDSRRTRLSSALCDLIDRLALPLGGDGHGPFAEFIRGLNRLLHRPPVIRPRLCNISEHYGWLLDPATHAVERLVVVRNDFAFDRDILALLRIAPTGRHWRVYYVDDRKGELSKLVPGWPELNDALFWYSADATRFERGRTHLGLNDDWPLQSVEHYWAFGPDSFPRVLDAVNAREEEDDRVIALSLAFRIYLRAEEPGEWLRQLHDCVRGHTRLTAALDERLHPVVPEAVARSEREWEKHQQKLERERREDAQHRAQWIARLKADPDVVRDPPGLSPGEFSGDQYGLLREVEGEDPPANRSQGSAWRSLIDEFGEGVAVAYRDAAMAHWRRFRPIPRSEGGDTRSIPYSLVFGMAGLAIEAQEVDGFPRHLCAANVRLALRYIVFEINGFPRWLESMYRVWPESVLDFVLTELFWELEHTEPTVPMNYLLHDLAFYAPWLHRALARPLLCWIRSHDLPSDDALNYSFRILAGGELDRSELVAVAKAKAVDPSSRHRASWYAVWVDTEPQTGVGAVTAWLDGMDSDNGSQAAQLFITALMGTRRDAGGGTRFGSFRTPLYLKLLYVLMHRHIRVTEDIDRTGGGVYSPGLRDEAQQARERLFSLLLEIPGKPAYVALSELIEQHPDPSARHSLERRARHRAEHDGDLEPWTAEQVAQFGDELTRTPTTHRQLFDLTLARMMDLKHWLERGNYSPYLTWQKAGDEGEIRNLVVGWLNDHWRNRYTVAQEPELANSQRMDIWLQNQSVASPVPIELKVLDMDWSGPKLCERLRNQLVGDYMREATAGCGLMLLVWQGSRPGRLWRIGGRLVGLEELRDALGEYWDTISNSFPNVEAVEVVLIDLTSRGTWSSEVDKE